MKEIKKRNNRGKGKKFEWGGGKQFKPADLPRNKNGIETIGDREPRTQVFPKGNDSR